MVWMKMHDRALRLWQCVGAPSFGQSYKQEISARRRCTSVHETPARTDGFNEGDLGGYPLCDFDTLGFDRGTKL